MKKYINKIAEQLKYGAISNNEQYRVESFFNSMFHTKKSKTGHLLDFYYLVS